MAITETAIKNFLKQQAKSDFRLSISEAKKQLASKLAEIEMDKNIKEAREDIKNGRHKTLNDKWIKNFILKSEKHYIRKLRNCAN